MYPGDYYLHVLRAPMNVSDRRVMARVALNTLLDPDRYRVDISEILHLPQEQRMRTRSFLAFCENHPMEFVSWGPTRCTELLKILEEA